MANIPPKNPLPGFVASDATTGQIPVKQSNGLWAPGTINPTTLLLKRYYGAVFDGGGLPIVAGKKAYVRIPVTGTIIEAFAMADVAGSIAIAVWKVPFASYPPTVANIISSATPITLTSALTVSDVTLSGWTIAVTAGDVICFNVNALATTLTWVSVGLLIQE